jgi:hypothetical protein
MTSITARYPGHCPGCSERIEIGDTITLASDDGAWVCRDCVNAGWCPTCWLVHPEGTCDR